MQYAQAGDVVSWHDTVVSPDGTHHLVDGAPLYGTRFEEVLKFHAPGLAPARDTSGMYHIDTSGNAAYIRRFHRTFGYYEGLAAVDAGEGRWHHVRPDGEPVYAARWTWCGNFQGGRCPVRDGDGRYFHIDPGGESAYAARWRYAGDFRDGIAVVQAKDGRSTHIDPKGVAMHGRWFLDLDVFHKAFARARDEGGWMHVNAAGEPLYGRRFGAVEPFYNGQARVERRDGGLEVIDEWGRTVVELRAATRSPLHAVSGELVSFWRCETVFAAARTGLFDRLPLLVATTDRPTTRLLAALGELGLVDVAGDHWVATSAGAVLGQDAPDSLAGAAHYWSTQGKGAWSQLDRALGDSGWRPADPFAEAASEPSRVRALHAALAPYARHDYARFATALDADHRVLIDAGGGSGALAATALATHPQLVATVLERPEVAAVGEVPAGLAPRLRFLAGDLFGPWGVRADAIVLARVLHDWNDEEASAILGRAREALDEGGRIYVVELVRPPSGFSGALLSLHMLVTTGGVERTSAEFESLFARSGLRLRELRSIGAVSQVLVVEAA